VALNNIQISLTLLAPVHVYTAHTHNISVKGSTYWLSFTITGFLYIELATEAPIKYFVIQAINFFTRLCYKEVSKRDAFA